jgi:hypothetical protein
MYMQVHRGISFEDITAMYLRMPFFWDMTLLPRVNGPDVVGHHRVLIFKVRWVVEDLFWDLPSLP